MCSKFLDTSSTKISCLPLNTSQPELHNIVSVSNGEIECVSCLHSRVTIRRFLGSPTCQQRIRRRASKFQSVRFGNGLFCHEKDARRTTRLSIHIFVLLVAYIIWSIGTALSTPFSCHRVFYTVMFWSYQYHCFIFLVWTETCERNLPWKLECENVATMTWVMCCCDA